MPTGSTATLGRGKRFMEFEAILRLIRDKNLIKEAGEVGCSKGKTYCARFHVFMSSLEYFLVGLISAWIPILIMNDYLLGYTTHYQPYLNNHF